MSEKKSFRDMFQKVQKFLIGNKLFCNMGMKKIGNIVI